MKTVCEINKCNGCMACTSICPKKCITVKDELDRFNAVVEEKQCIGCKKCEKVCPNVSFQKKNKPIKWKQGWADHLIRKKSTSGGAASAIIYTFIQSGGYVAACLFCDGEFKFELTNNLEVAKKFAGAKYVKSNPIGIYEKVEECLKTNRVLFVGLPCQVAAIKNYVNNDNLYTVDVICHGTPSIKLLNQFLIENGYDLKSIREIQFRAKNDYGLSMDGKRIYMNRVIDDYLCAFLSSIDYTENCYSCQFASLDRVSDITLGDSWGTEYRDEEKNGISLLLIQSEKGDELIADCGLELKNVDLNNAVKNNEQLSHPSILKPRREKFFKLIKNCKSFKNATMLCLPQMVVKQKIKLLMIRLHLMENEGDCPETLIPNN